MQFEHNHKIGNPVKVKFSKLLPAKSEIVFTKTLQLLGGIRISDLEWWFPHWVTPLLLHRIITNLCFVCGGVMIDSTALQNSLVTFSDFGNDRGSTQSRDGEPYLTKVRKCSSCGHSHT